MPKQQTLQNHVRLDKAYMALMLLNATLLVAVLCYGGRHYTALNWILLGLAIAVTSATMATRRYGLKNQDRIIRLEENVRLHWMGTDPSGLTMRQIIALRFASDEEVSSLALRAAGEKLSPKDIKAAIAQWRADHDRI